MAEAVLTALLQRWGEVKRQMITGEIPRQTHDRSVVIDRLYGSRLPPLPADYDRIYAELNPTIDFLAQSPMLRTRHAVQAIVHAYTKADAPLRDGSKTVSQREQQRRVARGHNLIFEQIRHDKPHMLTGQWHKTCAGAR